MVTIQAYHCVCVPSMLSSAYSARIRVEGPTASSRPVPSTLEVNFTKVSMSTRASSANWVWCDFAAVLVVLRTGLHPVITCGTLPKTMAASIFIVHVPQSLTVLFTCVVIECVVFRYVRSKGIQSYLSSTRRH